MLMDFGYLRFAEQFFVREFFVRQFASGFGSNGEVSGVSAGKVRVLPYCRG